MLWPRYLPSLIIGISSGFILKYYPFEPFKLTKLANVRRLDGHNGFRDLPIKVINAVCSIRPHIGLKLEAVIPRLTKLNLM